MSAPSDRGNREVTADEASSIRLIAFVTLLFVTAIGIQNGGGNHPQYLLEGIRRADPTFVVNDWFTWTTEPWHVFFTRMVEILERLGILEIGLAVGTVAVSVAFALATFYIAAALYDRPLLPWALTLAAFAGLRATTIGASPAISPALDAAAIAGALFACGIAAIAWGKPLLAGLSWGGAALVHGHLAVLISMLVVGLAGWLLLRRRFAAAAALFVPFSILGVPAISEVVGLASGPSSSIYRDVYMGVNFAQHYLPRTWPLTWYPPFVGAMLFGIGGVALRPPQRRPDLFAVMALVFFLVTFSLAVGWTEAIISMNRVWPWRLAPFLLFGGLLAGTAAIFDERRSQPGEAPISWMILIAGALVFLRTSSMEAGIPIAASLVLIPVAPTVEEKLGPLAPIQRAVVPIVVAFAFLAATVEGVSSSSLRFRAQSRNRDDAYEWARRESPAGAVFITPPDWTNFRLVTRRAVVADWRAVPYRVDEIEEWYERLMAISGGVTPESGADPGGYWDLSCDELVTIGSRYGASHAIVEPGAPCGTVVWSGDRYAVIELGP